MKRRHFLDSAWAAIAFLVPILLSVLVSCAPPPPTPIRAGLVVWPGYEPLYLARDLGYYEGQPIELRDYPSSTEITQAFRNGDISVAGLTLDETLLLAETIPDLQVVLVTDFSNGADVLIAKPEITTLKALKGHKIGVESSALGGYMVSRMLDQAGLALEDIQIVSLGVSEHEQAFKQKVVDAVVTFEPVRSNLLKTGAKILFDSTQIPGEIVDVLIVRSDLLKDQKASLEKLTQAWFRALNYQKQNPQDAARRMAPREQISPAQFMESLKLIQVPDLEMNLKLLSRTDSSLQKNTNRLMQVMLSKKLLKRSLPIDHLLSDDLVKTVKAVP